MDRKELHKRIIKSFVEPSLFYVPDGKKNDGLRIYTKYYNVYTKKVEEYDLVSKTIHTPVIRDENYSVTHPNFKMDGYYVIYDELKNIVTTSWHYEKKNDYVYMVNNGLYNTLDKVYPKGTYIIHEEVPPTYGFKQMNDFTLTLSAEGKLIDINKSIYRETLGYIFCGDPQTPNWHLPYLIDRFPIDTGIPCENPELYAEPIIVGGEMPYHDIIVRELYNGNPFKRINRYGGQDSGTNMIGIPTSSPSNYKIAPNQADDNRYIMMKFKSAIDEQGNPIVSDGMILFRTHRKIMTKEIDGVSYPLFNGCWYFDLFIGFDYYNIGFTDISDPNIPLPSSDDLNAAVDNYISSANPNDLQIIDGVYLHWTYPSVEELKGCSHGNKGLDMYGEYKNSNYAFLNDSGYYDIQSETFNVGGSSFTVKKADTKVEMLSENTPKYWESTDTAFNIFNYQFTKTYYYEDDNDNRYTYYIGSYSYYAYQCDTKSILDNSMIDKDLKNNPILIT